MRKVLLISVGIMALAAVFAAGTSPSGAYPVSGEFGRMPKAVVFTGAAYPSNCTTVGVSSAGDGGAFPSFDSGIIMTPTGDGSWACTATVFPGATYTYYFEVRIPRYEPAGDSITYFTTTEPGGTRNEDSNRSKTITIPDTAAAGFYVYNAFGDATVYGGQGPSETTVLSAAANPYIATYGYTGCSFVQKISSSGDADSSNMESDNPYSVSATQTGDSAFTVQWQYSMGGSGNVYSVEGEVIFDTDLQYPNYGFRILRAPDTNSAGFNSVLFTDITANNRSAITGTDTNFSPDTGAGWTTATSYFTDSSIPGSPDTFLYCVVAFNAYQIQSAFVADTSRQNFSGGYDTVIQARGVNVIFIVEQMNPEVVFPDGRNQGMVWVTPYVDGVRRMDLKQRVPIMRVTRARQVQA